MTDSEEPQARQVVVSRVVTEDAADWVVQEPMTQVVQRGTGRQAKLEDVTVFGKTGTAQKVNPEEGGYSSDRHISSFVCGAPADQPKLLVLVMVDEPQGQQYGGSVAAPTASTILKHSLRILK